MSVTCHKCGYGPAWLTTTKEETPYQTIYSVICRNCGAFYQQTVQKNDRSQEELGIGLKRAYPRFDCAVVGCKGQYSRVNQSSPALPFCAKHAKRLCSWKNSGLDTPPPIQLIDGVWVELRPSNRTNITPYRKNIPKRKGGSCE